MPEIGRTANAECWTAGPVGGQHVNQPGATFAPTSAAARIGRSPRDQLSLSGETYRNRRDRDSWGPTTAGHGPAATNRSGTSLPSEQLADVGKVGTHVLEARFYVHTATRETTVRYVRADNVNRKLGRPEKVSGRVSVERHSFEGPLTWSDTSRDSVSDCWAAIIIIDVIIVIAHDDVCAARPFRRTIAFTYSRDREGTLDPIPSSPIEDARGASKG